MRFMAVAISFMAILSGAVLAFTPANFRPVRVAPSCAVFLLHAFSATHLFTLSKQLALRLPSLQIPRFMNPFDLSVDRVRPPDKIAGARYFRELGLPIDSNTFEIRERVTCKLILRSS